jgi:hypothetical protein
MRFTLLATLLVSFLPATGKAVILYNAGLGSTPGIQGWLAAGVGNSATETPTGVATRLDTTAVRTDQFGYFSEDPLLGSGTHSGLLLDASAGYTIRFDLHVLSEGHDDNDRAGFSMVAISQDITRGLELAFFEDEVWAYNAGFSHGEGAAFDTTAGMVQYDYTVSGSSYSLMANGSPLLSGSLRNYNPTGLNALFDPYDNPSFLFFGDDTTRADADVLLGDIEVNPPLDMAVPEPGTALPLLICAIAAYRSRRRNAA